MKEILRRVRNRKVVIEGNWGNTPVQISIQKKEVAIGDFTASLPVIAVSVHSTNSKAPKISKYILNTFFKGKEYTYDVVKTDNAILYEARSLIPFERILNAFLVEEVEIKDDKFLIRGFIDDEYLGVISVQIALHKDQRKGTIYIADRNNRVIEWDEEVLRNVAKRFLMKVGYQCNLYLHRGIANAFEFIFETK